MKQYNETHKTFDNIAESAEYEEDLTGTEGMSGKSSRSKSDFDRLEYDEAMDMLNKPFVMDKTSRDGLPLTTLPIEYTTYDGQTLTTSTQPIP